MLLFVIIVFGLFFVRLGREPHPMEINGTGRSPPPLPVGKVYRSGLCIYANCFRKALSWAIKSKILFLFQRGRLVDPKWPTCQSPRFLLFTFAKRFVSQTDDPLHDAKWFSKLNGWLFPAMLPHSTPLKINDWNIIPLEVDGRSCSFLNGWWL